MKYFINSKERTESNTTCYFEFQKGEYCDECWKEDSVYIRDSLWDDFDVSFVFEKLIPDFDYFGFTKIDKSQWKQIVDFCNTYQPKCTCIINDVVKWVDDCFSSYDCFYILGM